MERIILVNDGTDHQRRVRAGVNWLIEKGGGTILIPLWSGFEDYFGDKRETYVKRMQRYGITIKKMERYLFVQGDVLALYPDEKQIKEIEDRERDGDTMAVEWEPKWLDWWRDNYDVVEYEVVGESPEE